ncbi:MAG: hybrid sensor histidine kinase/response regulator [Deltaproteobacteria bacterium]|nr:hybrid sensor histidine kinase/response regulator [Deltaproteobacteria bacterium]
MRQRVLVVDDEARNRKLVRAVLDKVCDVVEAASAADARTMLTRHDIDLVLLDVTMPGENGIDAARHMKAAGGPWLPIIMLTALSDQAHRNEALAAGADDFLSKPFDNQELVLRVEAFLRLRRQDRVIRSQRDELQKVIDLKDDLFGLLVHDLRNPLTSVIAMLHVLETDAPSADARADAIAGLIAARRVGGVIDDILQLIALEAGQMQMLWAELSLAAVAADAVATTGGAARTRGIELAIRGDAAICCDGALVRRAMENLLANAVRHAPRGSSVEIDVAARGESIVIGVSDRGPGVPEHRKGELFAKFGGVAKSGSTARRSYGFGLYLVDLVARAHHGVARVLDRPGGGARFELTLPLHQPS